MDRIVQLQLFFECECTLTVVEFVKLSSFVARVFLPMLVATLLQLVVTCKLVLRTPVLFPTGYFFEILNSDWNEELHSHRTLFSLLIVSGQVIKNLRSIFKH